MPHIGAHLAELTAITEGNPSFIPENPHLINMNKYSLYSNTLTTLRKMQRLKYNLTSVRMIVAALNHQIKLHSKLSLSESSEYSKMLFKMSEETESNTMITRYQSGDTSMVGSSIEHNQSNIDARRSPSPVVPPPPSDGHGHSSIHSTPSNTAHKKLPGSPTLSRKDSFSAQKKFRKSDAYDRIMKSTQNLEIAVSSQNLHENNDSDDSGQSEKNHSMKKSKAKSKLKAMVRAVIFTTKLKNNSV